MDNSKNNSDLTNIFINAENTDNDINNINSSEITSRNTNNTSNINNDYIVTMKVNLSENNVNSVIVPETVNIDKLITVPKKKYLEEIVKYKKDEITLLKDEIKEENEKKMEFMFKQLMGSLNYNLDVNPNYNLKNPIIKEDINEDDYINDPYKMKYTKIKNDNNSFKTKNIVNTPSLFSDSIKYESSEISAKSNLKVNIKRENNTINCSFSQYFNCIYIINLPDERHKLKNIVNIFYMNNIKFKIIDGIYAAKNSNNKKYYNRWNFQKLLNYSDLSKFLFDEKIYKRKNHDIIDILTSKTKSWNHWMNTGRYENRPLYEKTKINMEEQLGNLMAHINVIKDAIANNYNNILVLEDDVYLNKNFNEIHENIINKIPHYSILYYGAIQKNWEGINTDSGFYKANNTYGGFAYSLKNEYFNLILESMEELTLPIDKLFIHLQKTLNNSYVIYPNIFISDLENGKINRKREFVKYSKHFKWKVENYIIPKIE